MQSTATGRTRALVDLFAVHIVPLVVASGLIAVLATTEVDPLLVLPPHWTVLAVWWSYIVLLLVVSVWPDGRLHFAGMFLSGIVVASRAVGFAELVVEFGRWDLIGAVIERLLLLMLLGLWHIRSMQRHVLAGGSTRWMPSSGKH